MFRAALTFRENLAIAQELREDVAKSSSDALTGLANHRTFHEALLREASLARRHQRELSIVVLDIDDFRAINQIHGHQAGDAVITEVARRIGATLRSEDVLARIGGEEFACLLPSTSGQAAWRAAERARTAIEQTPFAGVGQVTVSAGRRATSPWPATSRSSCDWPTARSTGRRCTAATSSYRYSPEVMDVLSAQERAEQAERSRTLSAITALARAVDAKDATTQRHSERVGNVAGSLAGLLGWTTERRAKLHEAGLVHDVGKIGVPDAILRKQGPLTEAEEEVMKTHAALGARIVHDVLSPEQALWVLHHHERWDGAGLPARPRRRRDPRGRADPRRRRRLGRDDREPPLPAGARRRGRARELTARRRPPVEPDGRSMRSWSSRRSGLLVPAAPGPRRRHPEDPRARTSRPETPSLGARRGRRLTPR